jgi:hypothetical protein
LLFLAGLAGLRGRNLGGRGRHHDEADDRQEKRAHDLYAPSLSADYFRKHAGKREERSVVSGVLNS